MELHKNAEAKNEQRCSGYSRIAQEPRRDDVRSLVVVRGFTGEDSSSQANATTGACSELATEPDIYSPCVDTFGNYIDKIPNFASFPNGLRCPCGGRKDKYNTIQTFRTHTKALIHQKWLAQLTANKTNYYKENEDQKITIRNQKIIIAKLEQELIVKNRTIDYLTTQLVSQLSKETAVSTNSVVCNLLEFD